MHRELDPHAPHSAIRIFAEDEPSHGGASHVYKIQWRASAFAILDEVTLPFQHGPIKENGINGITNEALLAVVKDRLTSFQKGTHPCSDNVHALKCVSDALYYLNRRTIERAMRQAEGTSDA